MEEERQSKFYETLLKYPPHSNIIKNLEKEINVEKKFQEEMEEINIHLAEMERKDDQQNVFLDFLRDSGLFDILND